MAELRDDDILKYEDDATVVQLVRASVAELAALNYAILALTDSRHARTAYIDTAIVAPDTGEMWGALARISFPLIFTAIERLVGTFARDKVVDVMKALQAPDASDLPIVERIPKFTDELRSAKSTGDGAQRCARLQSELEQAFASAGLQMQSTLAARLVALKLLRNQCAHAVPRQTDIESYVAAAGFAVSVQKLGLNDLKLALNVVDGVWNIFSSLWFVGEWSSRRLDLMSDLPIYVRSLAAELDRHS